MSTEREQFEAFHARRKCKGQAWRDRLFQKLPDGTYVDDSVQRHWWTWQNAQASAQAPQPSQAAEREAVSDDAHDIADSLDHMRLNASDTVDGRKQIQADSFRILAEAASALRRLATASSGPDVLQHAREHSSGWVSVEERMPEPDSGAVLVWLMWGYSALDEWHSYREDPTGMGGPTMDMGFMWRDFDYEEVTHWMPLPAPPTSGQQGRVQAAEASGSDEQDQGADVKEGKQ